MEIRNSLNIITSISIRLTKSNFLYFSNSTNFSQSCVSISPLKPLKTTKNELNHRLPLILGEDGRRGLIEIGIWLSACPPKRTRRRMDPMADKYPSLSPFAYCANNPVMLVDPDGRDIEYNSLSDRICVAILRVTNSDFNNSFNTLKKSKEKYVFNGSSNNSRKQELTTDGDKLSINYFFNSSSSQGTNWANNIKHETEHAMQFEHGEVGFELFDTGGPVGGDGVYYPNNEWTAVNFDLDDEIKARDKGYKGANWNTDPEKNMKNKWRFGDATIDDKKQTLRNAGYKGEVPKNNPNHDKVKTSHQFMLPYRTRN